VLRPIVRLADQEIPFVYKCHGYTVAWTDGKEFTKPVFHPTGRTAQENALKRAQIAVEVWELEIPMISIEGGYIKIIQGAPNVAVGVTKTEARLAWLIDVQYRIHKLI